MKVGDFDIHRIGCRIGIVGVSADADTGQSWIEFHLMVADDVVARMDTERGFYRLHALLSVGGTRGPSDEAFVGDQIRDSTLAGYLIDPDEPAQKALGVVSGDRVIERLLNSCASGATKGPQPPNSPGPAG